jgi:hypothetical protein
MRVYNRSNVAALLRKTIPPCAGQFGFDPVGFFSCARLIKRVCILLYTPLPNDSPSQRMSVVCPPLLAGSAVFRCTFQTEDPSVQALGSFGGVMTMNVGIFDSKAAWTDVWHLWNVVVPRRSITGRLVFGQVWRRHDGRHWIYKKFVGSTHWRKRELSRWAKS